MNAANSERLLQHIRRLAGDPPDAPDGELLHRYRESREEAAFTALMRRHGPMVFSVCQSVLRRREDAEDAFQATFLILAQQAGSIRTQEGLSAWLQRVAFRVALRARANTLRRQTCEAQAARSPLAEPSCDDLSWCEMRSILHAELAALPERFRALLVLCHLEGLTQEEAARRLGCTAATVKGRLQRGREKLRRRLERRGVALSAALGAVLTGQTLAETAVRSGELFTRTATSAATALAQGFLHPVLTIKLALLSALVLSLGVVAGGMTLRSPSEPRPSESDGNDRSLTVAAPKDAEPRPAVDAHGDPLPDGAVARLGTIRFNHGDGLNALFFSPDGKTIYSEGNGNIRSWDADNGKERDRIRTTGMFSIDVQGVLLADGKTFLSLMQFSKGDLFTSWDLVQKKKIREAMLPVQRRGLSADHRNALSSDGKLAALHVDTPAQVQVFDLTTGKNLYQLAKGEKEFLAVAFAGNDRLVSTDAKQGIDVWEARSGKHLRRFSHKAPIRYLLASPDGRWLAGLEQRPNEHLRLGGMYLWDLQGDTVNHSLGAKMWIDNICFTPDSKSLLALSYNTWSVEVGVLWDCATGRRLLAFDKPLGLRTDAIAIDPDGKHLAAGSKTGKFDLWDLKTGHRLTSEESRYTQADAVVLSANGDRATIIGRTSFSTWDAATGRRLQAVDCSENLRFEYVHDHSSDGRYAVSVRFESGGNPDQPPQPQRPGEAESYQVCIRVWDLAAQKCVHTLRAPGGRHPSNAYSSVFAADSSLLATRLLGEPTRIRLWDVRGGKLLRSIEEKKGEGQPIAMNFTADGKTLFVAGANVTAYEVAGGKELFSWPLKRPHNPNAPIISERQYDRIGWGALAVSPEGTVIAATPWPGSAVPKSKDDAIVLYDAQTGKIVRRCYDPNILNYAREHLAFSLDGQLLASSNKTIVHLWETMTGKLIQSFKGHQGSIRALTFSRDGRRLASASHDNTVLIWDLTGSPGRLTTDAALEESWQALLGDDAGHAQRAVWALALTPSKSIPLLQHRLHPVKAINGEQLDRLMKDLDSDRFAVREKATTELQKLGELAAPALRRALANKPTLEQRRRIEPMLAALETKQLSGEALRSLRAVRVLEYAGTEEARRLLRELVGGAEGGALTREAQAAMTRLNRRAP